MSNQPVLRWEHEDAQNDVKIVAVYEDLGIGPMVLFDGAGFLDPDALGAFITSLQAAKLKLELLREPPRTPHCTCPAGRGTNPGCQVCP